MPWKLASSIFKLCINRKPCTSPALPAQGLAWLIFAPPGEQPCLQGGGGEDSLRNGCWNGDGRASRHQPHHARKRSVSFSLIEGSSCWGASEGAQSRIPVCVRGPAGITAAHSVSCYRASAGQGCSRFSIKFSWTLELELGPACGGPWTTWTDHLIVSK